MIRYTADGKVDRDMVSVPSFGTTTKEELADALDGAMQVTRDAIASMRECESRMRSAEDERDALRSALVHLEQAYSNKHSPQHRAAALNQAAGVLIIVDGCKAVRESQS